MIAALPSAAADAQTWVGGGANNDWTTPANWFADIVPANNGTGNVAFGGTNRLTPFVDTNNPWSIQTLTFNSSAGAFVFGGNTLSIGNTANGVGGITNNSANAEVFDNNISTAVSQTWTAASGQLAFAGTVTISGSNVLTVSGSQNTTFSGAVTGNSLVTGSLGSVTLGGSTDNTGLSVTATSSLTIFNKSSSATVHAVEASLTLSGGEVVLEGSGGDQIADTAPVTINSGTLDLFGNNETIGALNGSAPGAINNSNGSATLSVTGGGTFGGTIQNSAGTFSLLIGGTTPLILTGANTYNGNTGWATEGFMFRNSNGGPLRRTHFRSYSYVPLLKKAELPFIKFHSTRHTAASLALADGESVKLVSEMLGHSDASITLNVYAHVLPTQHRKRADRMGQLLTGTAG
jgi:hypothetical protein